MFQHEFKNIPDGPLNVDTEKNFKQIRNKLQADLMRDFLSEKQIESDSSSEGIEAVNEWSGKYSQKFRDIFHRLVVADPHLKDEATEIPDVLYAQIKEELYHEEGHINPEEYIDHPLEQPPERRHAA